MFRVTRWLMVLTALAMFAGGTAQAQTGTHKFKINGSMTATHVPLDGSSVSHPSSNVGTFLGRCQGQGHYRTLWVNPATGEFAFESAETYTFTAANGDKLVCTYGKNPDDPSEHGMGQAIPITSDPLGPYNAMFVAEFRPVGSECTGRFANCTGSFTMLAWSTQSFVPYFGTLLGDPPPQPAPPQPEYFFMANWSGVGTLTFPGN